METMNKLKRQPTEWQEVLTNDTSDKELISKMYRELLQLNAHTQTIQWKIVQKT